MDIKKYILDEAELHLPDDNQYTAIRWNLAQVFSKKTIIEDGIEYTANIKKSVRRGGPYIDFVRLRDIDSDDIWLDDDSPVDGGLSLKFAQRIQRELEIACEYLESLEGG